MEFISKFLGRAPDENNTLDLDNNRSSFVKNSPIKKNDGKVDVPIEDLENTLNVSDLAQELNDKLILTTPVQDQGNRFKLNKWAGKSPIADHSPLSTSDNFSPISVKSCDLSFVTARQSLTSNDCNSPVSESDAITADQTINISSDSADTLNLTLDESIIPKESGKTVVDDFEIVDINCDKDESNANLETNENVNENCSIISQDITYLSAEESISGEGTSRYASLENLNATNVIQNNTNYDVSVVGLSDLTQTTDYSIRNYSTTTFADHSGVDQFISEITVIEAARAQDKSAEKSTEGAENTHNSSSETLNNSIFNTHTEISSETDIVEEVIVTDSDIEEDQIENCHSELHIKSEKTGENTDSVVKQDGVETSKEVFLEACPEFSFEENRAITYTLTSESGTNKEEPQSKEDKLETLEKAETVAVFENKTGVENIYPITVGTTHVVEDKVAENLSVQAEIEVVTPISTGNSDAQVVPTLDILEADKEKVTEESSKSLDETAKVEEEKQIAICIEIKEVVDEEPIVIQAPIVEKEKSEPVLEEEKPKPIVKEEKSEPIVKEEKSEPIVEEEKPTPIVEEEKPAPIAEEEKPTPIVEEEKSETIVEEEKPAPIVEEEKPTPIVEKEKPAPIVEEEKPAPIVEEDKPAPIVEEENSAPIVEEEKPVPIVEEKPAPIVEEEKPAPIVEEEKSEPIVEEEKPAPIVEEEKSEPIVEEKPAPIVEEEKPAPIVEKEKPAPIVEEEKPTPIVEEGKPTPIVGKEKPESIVEKEKSEPIVEEEKPAPIVEEEKPAAIVEEEKPAPIVEEKPESIVEKEKSEPIIEKEKPAPIVEEKPAPIVEEKPESTVEKEKPEPIVEEEKPAPIVEDQKSESVIEKELLGIEAEKVRQEHTNLTSNKSSVTFQKTTVLQKPIEEFKVPVTEETNQSRHTLVVETENTQNPIGITKVANQEPIQPSVEEPAEVPLETPSAESVEKVVGKKISVVESIPAELTERKVEEPVEIPTSDEKESTKCPLKTPFAEVIAEVVEKQIPVVESVPAEVTEKVIQEPVFKTPEVREKVEHHFSNITQRKKFSESKPEYNDSLGEFESIEAQLSSDQLEEERINCEAETPSKAELSGRSESELLDNVLMNNEHLNKSEAGPNTADLSEEFQSADTYFLDLFAQKTSGLSESELRKQSLFVQFDPCLKKSPARPQPKPIMEDTNDSKQSELSESMNNLSVQENSLNGEVLKTNSGVSSVKLPAPTSTSTPNTGSPATLVSTSDSEKDKLIEKLTKEVAGYQKMLHDYENTITQCVNQRENDKKQFERYKRDLEREKEEVQTHLRNSEIAFNDVHMKYERSRAIIEGLKTNEDQLKASYAVLEEELKKQIHKYDALKTHAISQLEKGNQELDLKIKTNEMETAKLKALLKKAEMRAASLEESLKRKIQDNAELTSICDDLISKVGGQNV